MSAEEIRIGLILRSMIKDGKLDLSQFILSDDSGRALVQLLEDPTISLTALHLPAEILTSDNTREAVIASTRERLLSPSNSLTELSLPNFQNNKLFMEFLEILKTNKTLVSIKFNSSIRDVTHAIALEQILKLNKHLQTIEFSYFKGEFRDYLVAGLKDNKTMLSFGSTEKIEDNRNNIMIDKIDTIAPLLARNRDLAQKHKSETLAKSLRRMEKVHKTRFLSYDILKDIGRMADLTNKNESEAIERRAQRAAAIRTKNARNVEAEIANETDATDLLVKLIADLKPEIKKLSETTDKAALTMQCNEILDGINIQTEEILLSKKPLLNKEKIKESIEELEKTFKLTPITLQSNMPITEFEKSEMQNAQSGALAQIVNRLNRLCDLLIQPDEPATQSKSPKGP